VPMSDKWAHFLVFAVLFFLWAQALSVKNNRSISSVKLFFALVFYGIIIEVIQDLWYVSRTGDLMDVIANTVGILLGLILFHLRRRIYH